MRRRFTAGTIGLALVLSLGAWASADHVPGWYIDFTREFSEGEEPVGTPPWLRATFTNVGSDVLMRLEAINLSSIKSSTEFVESWYFNFDPLLDIEDLSFDYQSGLEADAVSLDTNQFKADGDGYFDIMLTYPTENSTGARFGQGDYAEYLWSFDGSGFSADSFIFLSNEKKDTEDGMPSTDLEKRSLYAAAKIQAIDVEDSGWVTGQPVPIPVPIAVWAGLALFGVMGVHRIHRARKVRE